MPVIRIVSILSLFLPFLFSCGSDSTPTVVLTDRPGLVQAVEAYTEEHPELPLVVRYTPAVTAERVERREADLVVASGIHTDALITAMRPLDTPNMPLTADRDFYSALLRPTRRDGRQMLAPISFGLPIVAAKSATTRGLPDPMIVDPETLMAFSAEWSRTTESGRWTRLGFSPSWDGQFLLDLLMIRQPAALGSGPLAPDAVALTEVLAEARGWVESGDGTMAKDVDFDRRYRYVPDVDLILDGRILFTRIGFEEWTRWPEEMTEDLDFRYLSGPREIPVVDAVYAGIPRRSDNTDAAAEFLAWILDPGVQERLMDRWRRQGLKVFGVFGGLSSRPRVNEGPLTERFPRMEGKIPEGHYLADPVVVPDRWSRIRGEVLVPWLENEFVDPSNTDTLDARYREWDLGSLDDEL